ncbi:MAG TPA: phosphatase PAP2-related protein [Cyclobacteriaceae bacterium]|nr:phosphatase PAP2-related protein [Cyclobacteriaceae bacterium]
MTWKEALSTSRYRWAIVFCAATLLWMFLFVPVFYRDILTPKPGYLLNDYFLGFFTPRDLSLYIFIILYAATVQTIISHWKDPEVIILASTVYVAMNIVRTATMYLITLEPPTGIILLEDPISSLLYPDTGFAKDLFFSGHISTIMVTVFVERNTGARRAKIAGAVMMAVLLAWQHVHYSVDLIVAPLATYGVFLIARHLLKSTKFVGKYN